MNSLFIIKVKILMVVIFHFFLNNLRHIPHIPLNLSVVFLKILNINQLFLKLNQLIYN